MPPRPSRRAVGGRGAKLPNNGRRLEEAGRTVWGRDAAEWHRQLADAVTKIAEAAEAEAVRGARLTVDGVEDHRRAERETWEAERAEAAANAPS